MAIVSTVTLSGAQQIAFEHAAHFGYRAENLFRSAGGFVVSHDVGADPQKGQTFTLTKINKLAANITVLPETTDISGSSLGSTPVSVTLNEQGDVVQTTKKLRVTSFLDMSGLVPMHEIGKSMGNAIDQLVRINGFDLATNVIWTNGTTDNTMATGAGSNISAKYVAQPRAKLKGAFVPTIDGGVGGKLYRAMIHPDVVYDLTGETAGRGWRAVQINNAAEGTSGVADQSIGAFEGAMYVENPVCKVNTAATNTDVYTTYFYGEEAIAELVGVEPGVRITGPFDSLARFLNTGWYAMIGWNLFRPESLWHIRSNSSIGNRP